MAYFSINPSKKNKDKWIVCRYPNITPLIDYEFESAEIASHVAEKMNYAYQEGVTDTQEKTIENLKEMLFKD